MFPGPRQHTSFEEWLRGLVHNIGHFMVGGTMMTLYSSGETNNTSVLGLASTVVANLP
jgi:hypothetical protein